MRDRDNPPHSNKRVWYSIHSIHWSLFSKLQKPSSTEQKKSHHWWVNMVDFPIIQLRIKSAYVCMYVCMYVCIVMRHHWGRGWVGGLDHPNINSRIHRWPECIEGNHDGIYHMLSQTWNYYNPSSKKLIIDEEICHQHHNLWLWLCELKDWKL
jgi:hypothetical protein